MFQQLLPGITNFRSTLQRYWHITDRRQRCFDRILAVILSATSFWNVRVNFVLPNFHGPDWLDIAASHIIIRGVDTLNGRLPMMWILGGAESHGTARFSGIIFSMLKLRMSPLCMLKRPCAASDKSWKMYTMLTSILKEFSLKLLALEHADIQVSSLSLFRTYIMHTLYRLTGHCMSVRRHGWNR